MQKVKVKLISAPNAMRAPSFESSKEGKKAREIGLGIVAGNQKRVKWNKIGEVREMVADEAYDLLKKCPQLFAVEAGTSVAASAAKNESDKQAEKK